MNREDIHKLLVEISGGGEVGAEAYHARTEGEKSVLISIQNEYGGLLLEGDAIHQLYMDLIRDVLTRLSTLSTTPMLHLFFHWHVLSASRFYAAFDLFKRGYYFECSTLARTIWETALTITALKRNVITIEELFGGSTEAGRSLSDKERLVRIRKVDSRVKKTLIWENRELSPTAISAVEAFDNLVNSATHKSNLGLAINMGAVESGASIHVFPVFDPQLTGMSGNLLFLASWCLMYSMAYLDDLLPENTTELWKRYQKLLFFFDELMKNPPNEVVEGFGEIMVKVFDLQSMR